MIIVKLADGSLWVNSPVSVPLDMLDRNIALGPVRYLVAPTRMHAPGGVARAVSRSRTLGTGPNTE
jgi:hypothetical protein